MSQLIQMRRRIKVIETIAKITNAMRLIAMSGHARLKHKEEHIKSYVATIEDLYRKVGLFNETEHVSQPQHTALFDTELIILVGSQKGLCGNFNHVVLKHFEHYIENKTNIHLFAVGKKSVEYCKSTKKWLLVGSIEKFNTTTINEVVAQTIAHISTINATYKKVTVVANALKTFFTQRPVTTQLLPFEAPEKKADIQHIQEEFQEYSWDQAPDSIIHDLSFLFLEAKLHTLLFQSLLAEQAARFLSMDSSTRNAQGLLEVSKIQYNKLRQAKITKEINELASSM